MTEKRFYYNTFYHADDMSRVLEYEIIDRQSYPNYPNYDEKEDIPNWYIYISENDSGWQDMLVNLLNELSDENDGLKKQITSLKVELDTHKHPLWSTRESERKVSELTELLADEVKKNGELLEEINSLRKENMRLKELEE